jgi:hypothetical protein
MTEFVRGLFHDVVVIVRKATERHAAVPCRQSIVSRSPFHLRSRYIGSPTGFESGFQSVGSALHQHVQCAAACCCRLSSNAPHFVLVTLHRVCL